MTRRDWRWFDHGHKLPKLPNTTGIGVSCLYCGWWVRNWEGKNLYYLHNHGDVPLELGDSNTHLQQCLHAQILLFQDGRKT